MNYDQMTLKTQDAIQEAGKLAMQKSSSEIGNEHLLTAMLRQKDGTIPPLVEWIGVQPETLLAELEHLIDQYPTVSGNTQMPLSSEAQRTLALAEQEMSSLKDLYLSTEHLFLAMTEDKGKTGAMLRSHGCGRSAQGRPRKPDRRLAGSRVKDAVTGKILH